jgi:hypothetical protein
MLSDMKFLFRLKLKHQHQQRYHAPPCSRAEGVAAAVEAGSDIADGNEYNQTLAQAVINGNITLGDAQQRLFNTLLIRFRCVCVFVWLCLNK